MLAFVLSSTHWIALSLATCLVLTMVVRRRPRVVPLSVAVLFAFWYGLSGVDAPILAAVGAAPTMLRMMLTIGVTAAIPAMIAGSLMLVGRRRT